MMQVIKKPAVIVIVILLAITLLFLLSSRTTEKGGSALIITPTPIPLALYPQPQISPIATNQATVFTIAFSPKDQERAIQTYQALPSNPFDVASRLASRLLSNPTITNDSGIRFWKTDTAMVTGQETPSRVSYQISDLPVQQGPGLADADAEELAMDALYNSGAINQGYTLVQSGISRFDGTHLEGDVEVGGLTKVGFVYQFSKLPIVDETGGALFASVTLDPTGKILELSAAVAPASVPAETIDIIPVGQAVLALTNNKGVLTSAKYDIVSVGASLTHPSIKTATITSMTLQYLWDKTKQSITPVYAFEGFSDDDTEGGRVKLIYFVSATLK